jgi:diguanylate cyclase (GGDEF)-like protein
MNEHVPNAQACAHYNLELERLVDVVQQLSLARSVKRIAEIVRHEARELTGADGATFVLREGESCYYADEEAISPLWKGQRFPMDSCVSGWVMSQGRPVMIEDIYADERVPIEAYRPTFVKSLLMVPIRAANPIGAIGDYWASPHQTSEEEVRLLQALADTTAVAMENVLMYSRLEQTVQERTQQLQSEIAERKRTEEALRQMAISDELTGLLNRRGFYLQAEQELKIARRNGQPSLLVFTDLDGLKLVNDRRGHDIGDRMIKDAANVLRLVFRNSDVLARIGGDEFVAFTLDARDPTALRQRLLQAVDQFNVQQSRPYELSLSVGVVGCEPDAACSLEQLLERADSAMYREKQRKRAVNQWRQ